MAADGKATARVNADRAINAATAAVNELATKLKSGEGTRAPARALSGPRQALADAERALQEARAAFAKGDYLAAQSKASAVSAPLAAASKDLQTAAATPPRRRR
jgi:hypothetical protein